MRFIFYWGKCQIPLSRIALISGLVLGASSCIDALNKTRKQPQSEPSKIASESPAPSLAPTPMSSEERISATFITERTNQYATFATHHQRIVENGRGIFITYLHGLVFEPDNTNCNVSQISCLFIWRLARSIDGGATFSSVFEGRHRTRAPVVETDSADNIYVAHPLFDSYKTMFYRFDATNGFTRPLTVQLPVEAEGKYTSYFDPTRNRYYYFTRGQGSSSFYAFDRDFRQIFKVSLTRTGTTAGLEYPHLAMNGSMLYAAWTTQLEGQSRFYGDIRFAASADGGQTWQKADGTSLPLPIVADSDASDGLFTSNLLPAKRWLSNFVYANYALHFGFTHMDYLNAYYRRFSLASPPGFGVEPPLIDFPNWRGANLQICSSGFFSVDRSMSPAVLYQTGVDCQDQRRVVTIVSRDNGRTWADYAVLASVAGKRISVIHSLSEARAVSSDGYILGALAYVVEGETDNVRVGFFKVKTGLASL